MDFLKNKGFTDEEINKIINKYNGSLDSFMFISDNVEDVIDYFNSYGIKNVAELMLKKIDISNSFSGTSIADGAEVGLFNGKILDIAWSSDNSHILFKTEIDVNYVEKM